MYTLFNFLHFIDDHECQSITGKKENIFISSPNNGLSSNCHFHEIKDPITDDQKCKPIRTGPNVARTVGDYRLRSWRYYQDYKPTNTRFPPSFYLDDSSTARFADKIEKMDCIKDSSVKILTKYHPINHLRILGLLKKQYDKIVSNAILIKNV